MTALRARLQEALAPVGLNLFGAVSRARYDAAAPPAWRTERIHPPTRAILVIGSGGRAHWDAFLAHVAASPRERLARRAHPLDAFTAEAFASLAPALIGCRVLFPTFDAPLRLDFMRLAALAGFGQPSELGILVGPRFGPWFGLRAAVFTPGALEDDGPVRRACDGCAAPCLTHAAPLDRRLACVAHPEARYDALELAYHYDRPRGRRMLCERFGVADELASPPAV